MNSGVLRNEKYNGSSNVLYAGHVPSDEGIECVMKNCRIVYCFCRARKIMPSGYKPVTSYGGLDVTFL